jgi:predicted metal-dependent hydrolase
MYFILIIIIIIVFILINNINIIQIETLDGNSFLIHNENDNDLNNAKITLLNKIITNLINLKEHLIINIENFPKYKSYILQLDNNFTKQRTKIYETNPKSNLTSYSVNKGEELSICLKSKINNKLHNENILMYVLIHEMAHFACPEIGHGELFQIIFKFLLDEAIKINIYIKEDYLNIPSEYCGLMINSSILNN